MRMRRGLSVVVVLVLGACGGMMKTGGEPAVMVTETLSDQVALGKRLAEGIMACGSCHTSGNFEGDPDAEGYLAGDAWLGQPWGRIGVPNITPDMETGIGGWTDPQLLRALTNGYSRDCRALIP